MLGSLTHKEIIVGTKGSLVDKGIGPPFNGAKSALKLHKPVPFRYNLHILLGNCMVLGVSGVQRKFFGQKIRSQHAVWMQSAEVGALFRFIRKVFFDGSETGNKKEESS